MEFRSAAMTRGPPLLSLKRGRFPNILRLYRGDILGEWKIKWKLVYNIGIIIRLYRDNGK